MHSTEIQEYLVNIFRKDPVTCNHCGKAAEYALRLGLSLELADDELEALSVAAALHDIGKVKVPDNILFKPDSLTEEEYAVMKCHPDWGAEIIERQDADDPQRKLVAQIVRYHHERYDGGGYPEGIPGERIPFLAQIVAIADAFDAMTSDRPYRSRMPVYSARCILVEERGRQFNPDLVDSFVKLIA